MDLLDNIRFTRERINRLYDLGLKYKWLGPEAPVMLRWIYRLLRLTPWGQKREQLLSSTMKQFERNFTFLQRSSLVPPAYWDTKILTRFEQYVLNNQAYTIEQCIELYRREKPKNTCPCPERWEMFYLKRIRF